MAQTVFINLYLHDPSLVKDRTLKAFCVCFLKLVDNIRDRINRASVFEEVGQSIVVFSVQKQIPFLHISKIVLKKKNPKNKITCTQVESQISRDIKDSSIERLTVCRSNQFQTLNA